MGKNYSSGKSRKAVFICLFFLIFLGPKGYSQATDTASTNGLTFTDIATSPAKNNDKKVAVIKKEAAVKPVPAKNKGAGQTIWEILIAGMLGGFAAVLMPCIFPMLPLTVSFFTKSSDDHKKGIRKALVYGISIIAIYVGLGLVVTLLFGSDALNNLSTNGVFNFLFFLMLVAFAASFLGAFELALPSAWINKMDERSDKGGYAGIFFMAATLALISFSCTGPIIGTLLVQTATTGALLAPAVGMFGFSFALAIPFVIFAMFPSLMRALPKSGGWLNSIKVVLGFLELALSLKFLSNVDLAYHWHLLDREVFLVLWIVIAGLTGAYLLGKIKFSHDSDYTYTSVPRLFLAIIVLSFTVYMVPGLWGAPLRSISALLPPQSTQDFDLYTRMLNGSIGSARSVQIDNRRHKYAQLFDKPLGLSPFFDYDEGIAYAKNINKPVMIDFTGHACVNCRKMEANVWHDKNVCKTISQDYVLIQLYVDDKTDLQPSEQTVTPEGKHIRTIGNKWSDLQATKFLANSQPFYVLLDPKTEQPLVEPQGANYDAAGYMAYLQSGLNAYGKR